MRLEALLRRAARLHAARGAVRDEAGELSFAALDARARQLARGLAAAGLRPGQRVVVLAQNRAATVELFFALFELGAVVVPLNPRLRPGEIAFVAGDARAAAVFADASLAPAVAACDAARFAVAGPAPEGWGTLDALRERGAGAPEVRSGGAPGDVALQLYTSGTTGRPKGSMLAHAGFWAMTSAWLDEVRLDPGDRFLQVTPLFHVGALLMLLSTVAAGATLRLCGEFDARTALGVLRDERITHALFVPTMVRWLLDEPDAARGGFDALRLIVYGAAPMPVDVLERALATFGCDFLQGYGLTETAGVLTTLRPADHRHPAGAPERARLASVGRAVCCSEVAVVDAAGRDVAAGAVGEVVARGPNVHLGYQGEAQPESGPRPGWFATGDLARMDEDGYVYLVDRRKDMICVAGENVYPREVEDALATHPAVRESAVIGIPHDHWGEEVLAVVVPAAGAAPDARALVQHCRAALARFKCPTKVELAASLPRNAAGKVLKKELREPWWRGRERKV